MPPTRVSNRYRCRQFPGSSNKKTAPWRVSYGAVREGCPATGAKPDSDRGLLDVFALCSRHQRQSVAFHQEWLFINAAFHGSSSIRVELLFHDNTPPQRHKRMPSDTRASSPGTVLRWHVRLRGSPHASQAEPGAGIEANRLRS